MADQHQGAAEPETAAIGDSAPADEAQSSFPIVALGGSAGALHALQEFFGAMPLDSGCAFVVITHQHPDRESLLPELLQSATAMPVMAVRNSLPIEPENVYVSVPDGQVEIRGGTLVLDETPAPKAAKPPTSTAIRAATSSRPPDCPATTFCTWRARVCGRHCSTHCAPRRPIPSAGPPTDKPGCGPTAALST